MSEDRAVCRCGHPAAAHEHYRDGTDCSACERCTDYRPRHPSSPDGGGMPALVHCLPDDDVIAHESTERCVCGPRREPVGVRQLGHTGQHVIALVHQRLAPDEPTPEA